MYVFLWILPQLMLLFVHILAPSGCWEKKGEPMEETGIYSVDIINGHVLWDLLHCQRDISWLQFKSPNYPILEVQIKNSINTKLNFKATFSMFKENWCYYYWVQEQPTLLITLLNFSLSFHWQTGFTCLI